MYIYIYIYIYINGPSHGLSPRLQFHIAGTNEPKSAKQARQGY